MPDSADTPTRNGTIMYDQDSTIETAIDQDIDHAEAWAEVTATIDRYGYLSGQTS